MIPHAAILRLFENTIGNRLRNDPDAIRGEVGLSIYPSDLDGQDYATAARIASGEGYEVDPP